MVRYAEPDELRAQPDVQRDVADELLAALLDAASRAIDNLCNRPEGFVAPAVGQARLFWGQGMPHLSLGDFVALGLVEVLDGGGGWNTLTPVQPFSGSSWRPSNRLPYTGIVRTDGGIFLRHTAPSVRVTARWGYAETVPPQVKQATIILASRWWMRGRTAWSDATAGPDLGTLLYRQDLDPDVRTILERGRLLRPAL